MKISNYPQNRWVQNHIKTEYDYEKMENIKKKILEDENDEKLMIDIQQINKTDQISAKPTKSSIFKKNKGKGLSFMKHPSKFISSSKFSDFETTNNFFKDKVISSLSEVIKKDNKNFLLTDNSQCGFRVFKVINPENNNLNNTSVNKTDKTTDNISKLKLKKTSISQVKVVESEKVPDLPNFFKQKTINTGNLNKNKTKKSSVL